MSKNMSRSSSTRNHEVPSKRRKLNPLNSSTPDPSDNNSRAMSKCERIYLTRELVAVSIRLSHTEVTASKLHEMRKQVEEVFDEEKEVLDIQAGVEKETTDNLKRRLGTALESTQEAHEPQEIAEPDMSPMKSRMLEKLKTLFLGNVGLDQHAHNSNPDKSSTSSKCQETEPETQEVSDKRMKIELERMLEVYLASQDSDLELTQARGVNIQPWKLRSLSSEAIHQKREQTGANELHELLHSTTDITSTLRETVKKKLRLEKQISNMQKRLDDDRVEQQMMDKKCKELLSKILENKSTRSGLSPAASKHRVPNSQQSAAVLTPKKERLNKSQEDERFQRSYDKEKKALENALPESDSESSDNDSSSDATDNKLPRGTRDDRMSISSILSDDDNQEEIEAKQPPEDLRINVGDYYVLPSHPAFFSINWKRHYLTHYEGTICYYDCKKCREMYTRKQSVIQDHIWVKHLGQQLKCPFCPDSSFTMTSRYRLLAHIRGVHPNRYKPKK